MVKLSRHRVLIAGVLSPMAAVALSICIGYYAEHWSRHFPASLSAILPAMIICTAMPFLTTLFLAAKAYHRRTLCLSGKIGLAIAALSLIVPVWAGYTQFIFWRRSQSTKLHDVPAPIFSTLDLNGMNHSLSDEKGKVVLVNVWGTWCGSGRAEMPELDRLYREHKDEGLVVFGLSDEDVATQEKCLEKIPVSYPLLTYKGQIPAFYRQIAAYPTTFLIDRQGKLQRGVSGVRRPVVEMFSRSRSKLHPFGGIPESKTS